MRRFSDCWPTAEQTLLLRAALLDGEEGRRALAQWRSRVAVDRLDYGSSRLLPLLYQRLRDERADPLLPGLREAFERAALRNEALIETAGAAIRTLGAAGIASVTLKGMALVARGFTSPAARPMADCDLLVPEALALAARNALVAGGWRADGRLDADLLPLRHAVQFTAPSGHRLDLHWHVLADCCYAGADDDFWRAAEPASLKGAATHTLCAADMILHICVHGVRWSIVPPVRWAADALAVVRAADPPIDWERVAAQAEARMLVLPMIDTLEYLRDELDAPIPAWIGARLSRVPVPPWARAEYRIKKQPRTVTRQVAFHWFQHRRLRAHGSLLGDAVRFPSYMRRRWRFRALARA